MALQMAFKAINDSVGPNGLIPTLLVYGAYPRLTERDAPTATVTQRANAIKKAMAEIQKIRAQRQINDALHTRNGPSTTAIHSLNLNSQVLVWREGNTGQSGNWNGPYRLVSVDNKTCIVELPYGNTSFRSTAVKPFLTPEKAIIGISLPLADSPTPINSPTPTDSDIYNRTPIKPIKRSRGRPRKYPVEVNTYLQEPEPQYKASRQLEITGLIDKGVFEAIYETSIPQNTRIFNARFVDEIKNPGTDKATEKSRLVVQAYHDEGKRLVLTQSLTI